MRKSIGFLSFGYWRDAPGSGTRSAAGALTQSVDLTVAAEEIGFDGAYFRVHHFAQQLTAPFPLLAAAAARTSRIELGTGVIDMRYENPLYMAENAAATDLLSQGRLQLGLSRGAPGQAKDGPGLFGYAHVDGTHDVAEAREKTTRFLSAIEGTPLADPDLTWAHHPSRVPIEPQSPGLRERIWWGAGTRQTALWAAEQGMNLQSSTVLLEDTGVPLDVAQAEQIRLYRDAWRDAGWTREPRVAVTRSVLPLTTDQDWALFGRNGDEPDRASNIPGYAPFRTGRTYTGEPDRIADLLAKDEALAEADTILLTLPTQLGVDYAAHLMTTLIDHVAPTAGWH
jgi:alkanesulfonate monooxygenase SsuD/methylene tetrahydromethanopterin reductase-like flavin-dependent oxidoreductase (luciferase family)